VRCVETLQANRNTAQTSIDRSLAMVTGLTPRIGYDKAAAIAKEALRSDRNVRDVAVESTGLTRQEIDELLSFKA
jgi:fumarate hydratase class II